MYYHKHYYHNKSKTKRLLSLITSKLFKSNPNAEKHGCKCYMEHLTPGEQHIADTLADGLSYKDYFIFNNLTIPSPYNISSQIDHLIISKFGIFVIESKDKKGLIFGDTHGEHWTQILGHTTIQFQNPIHQNYSHITSLQALLPLIPKHVFQNIVVFTQASQFKSEPIPYVVHEHELISHIQKSTTPILTEETVQNIIGKLSYTCQTADISPEKHIENIQASHIQ